MNQCFPKEVQDRLYVLLFSYADSFTDVISFSRFIHQGDGIVGVGNVAFSPVVHREFFACQGVGAGALSFRIKFRCRRGCLPGGQG